MEEVGLVHEDLGHVLWELVTPVQIKLGSLHVYKTFEPVSIMNINGHILIGSLLPLKLRPPTRGLLRRSCHVLS